MTLRSEIVKEAASTVAASVADALESDGSLWPGMDDFPSRLEAAFAVSPYMMQVAQRYPALLSELLASGGLLGNVDVPSVDALEQELQAAFLECESRIEGGRPLAEEKKMALQLQVLRQFRHMQMFRILWLDFSGGLDLDGVLHALSSMADACIRKATQWAEETVSARFGQPLDSQGQPQHLIVLGMGKLGGHELNVSSDIDLIYLFREAGVTSGDNSIENDAYFRRVAQTLTQLLGNTTEDGFVFRVDTRLRPFGISGPLVMNFNGLEQYYLTQGRDWERYAMIKARPITGSDQDVQEWLELVTPFVFRRYLDYSAIDSLRELKRKISLSVKQKGLVGNVKLGVGGIREIEFIGQAFQLVRGGRQERLRTRSIKSVLHCLHDMKLMPIADVQLLCEAYDFLRRVENAVQCMRDQQVHSIPTDADDKDRLLSIMRYSDWDEFETTLQQHRDVVAERFNDLFSDWEQPENTEDANKSDLDDTADVAWAVLTSPEIESGAAEEAVQSLGLEPDDELMEGLFTLTRGLFYQRLTTRAQERVDRILPLLIAAAMQEPNRSLALLRCLHLVRAVAGRSGYLQILIERPPALARLVALFSRSEWVANFVTRHPIVIDELLRENSNNELPSKEQLYADALHEAGTLESLELDVQMDAMRQFQQTRLLSIAVAELTQELPLMRVSDQLTWLAEAVIAAVVRLVEHGMPARYGKPRCVIDNQEQIPEFGVVAYGKLGGIELSFGSDLDLVFVHNSEGQQQQTNGEKQVDNSFYYARLAQKVVHFMTTHTPGGVLYDIDLRLRPNGQSGVLVTGLESYEQYQLQQAWTWEHQALVRTRMILGGEEVANRFQSIRLNVLGQKRNNTKLLEEVVSMRQRMRENLASGGVDVFHLKNDPGGIADIEFMVQYLVLANAEHYTQLLDFPDNIRILEQAAKSELISQQDCAVLTGHYLSLRRLVHRQALQNKSVAIPVSDLLTQIVNDVIDVWSRLMTLAE